MMFSWARRYGLLLVPVAFVASVASANATTLGSNNAAEANYCTNGFSWVQQATAANTPSYQAPSKGTITSWTTSATSASQAALKIWRPTSNSLQFTPVAQSATETVPSGSKLATFSTAILVQKGDVIGIAAISGSLGCIYFAPSAGSGDVAAYTVGDPTSGTQSFTSCTAPGCATGTGSRLNLTAQFTPAVCVVPKLNGKTLANAKAALSAAHCALGTVTKKTSSGTAGIVLSQSPTPGKQLPAGSKVDVVVSEH
jgi:hypothetical protein